MEAKELRISNYVNFDFHKDSGGTKGIEVFISDLEIILQSNFKSKYYTPIPLTEDWLVKFGFEKGTIENDNWAFTVFFYDIWRVVYKEKKGYGTSDVYLENFYSVHQLQNLYFALSNKELTIKINNN